MSQEELNFSSCHSDISSGIASEGELGLMLAYYKLTELSKAAYVYGKTSCVEEGRLISVQMFRQCSRSVVHLPRNPFSYHVGI